ncbi:FtsB family cell division protein [Brachyspira hyodysenteriae]|uniref:FtsB family cell division protein n=1 Tax=Brachyspira hyodysenteriae TaxID=159 RepID=UPI0022CDC069|nr:septum formation initiator family protein [Brachyspira hyodysenteriae]MDA0022957.1 septum formation initiator family protein [Brachyspira hyodysenteriae]MDA0079975.1 septum formation initiator family protein [Brachyspira hyodysenteriae]
MYFNVRISSKIFYGIILVGIAFMVYVFVFSPKGFLTLDAKKVIIESKKKKVEELNRRKIQISNNIERLKTDKEYILSYAKTFGYLDGSKNEKIIKIIKNDEETKNTQSVLSSSIKENDNYLNIRGALILALMIALCFITYLLLINKNLLPRLKKKKIITSKG